jgi:hypothetical protein
MRFVWVIFFLCVAVHYEVYGYNYKVVKSKFKTYERFYVALSVSAIYGTQHSSKSNERTQSNSEFYPSQKEGESINKSSSALSTLLPKSNIEFTRGAMVRIIEESWSSVSLLIPESTLALCEEELKGATSLLVLATVRRAADDSAISRATVEGMFKDADVNNDGQLTFLEWFEWLGSTPSPSSYPPQSQRQKSSVLPADPMVAALSDVLSNAVCTLKTTARITQDPSVLSAAFVAGGTMAGILDAQVCKTMISRLSPRTREIVTMSLNLEAASLPSSMRASSLSILPNYNGGIYACIYS